MLERIVGAVGGGLRIVLLVAALVVALLPIVRGATSGFCPPETVEEGASAAIVAAAPTGLALATIVEPTEDEGAPTEEPTDGTGDAPTEEPGASEGEEAVIDAGPCGPGVDECLPPLLSAVLEFGDDACGSEAVSRLRSSMIPAFFVASGLLVGAWVLRPRDGAPVLSRW